QRWRMQVVVIEADCTDDLEPGRVVLLQLREATGNGAQATGRRDVGIAAAVKRAHVILKRINPERDRVAPVADIKPCRIVDVDAEGIERIAALVADTARDVVTGAAVAAKGRATGAVMKGLGLVVVGTVAVQRHTPVPEIV